MGPARPPGGAAAARPDIGAKRRRSASGGDTLMPPNSVPAAGGGAPDASQTGARNWAGYPPNLANVAVSRAKEALYVVGNRELWRMHGSFRTVNDRLPT